LNQWINTNLVTNQHLLAVIKVLLASKNHRIIGKQRRCLTLIMGLRNFVETTEKYHKNPWKAKLRENLFARLGGFAQLVSDAMENNTYNRELCLN
jgi:hypothetical protein